MANKWFQPTVPPSAGPRLNQGVSHQNQFIRLCIRPQINIK